MAVPTITAITPTTGHVGGRTIVKIEGTNFAVPPAPSPGEDWVQTLSVTFNGIECQNILPYGADMAMVVTPAYTGDPVNTIAVDVVLTNLDPATGLPVAGETVTESDGFTFSRPSLDTADCFQWLISYLIAEMRRQIMDNIVVGSSVDYDPDQTTAAMELTTLPGIIVTQRPELFELGQTTQLPETITVGTEFRKYAVGDVVDVFCEVRGMSHSDRQILNIANRLREFCKRLAYLQVPGTVGDIGSAVEEIPVHMTMEPIFIEAPSNHNPIYEFTSMLCLRGVQVTEDDIAVLSGDFHGYRLEGETVETEQF